MERMRRLLDFARTEGLAADGASIGIEFAAGEYQEKSLSNRS
jgi:hypothetical protein